MKCFKLGIFMILANTALFAGIAFAMAEHFLMKISVPQSI